MCEGSGRFDAAHLVRCGGVIVDRVPCYSDQVDALLLCPAEGAPLTRKATTVDIEVDVTQNAE